MCQHMLLRLRYVCMHREAAADQVDDQRSAARNMTMAELAHVAQRRGISLDVLLEDARSRGIVIDE